VSDVGYWADYIPRLAESADGAACRKVSSKPGIILFSQPTSQRRNLSRGLYTKSLSAV